MAGLLLERVLATMARLEARVAELEVAAARVPGLEPKSGGPPVADRADAVLVHNCGPVDMYIRYESGMSRNWFDIKAANLTQLSDAGVLVKTRVLGRIPGLTGRYRNSAIKDLWSKTSPGSARSPWYEKLSDMKGYHIDHVR